VYVYIETAKAHDGPNNVSVYDIDECRLYACHIAGLLFLYLTYVRYIIFLRLQIDMSFKLAGQVINSI
jgi:hypothetical protein